MQRNIIIRPIDQNVNACVESYTISYLFEDDKILKKLSTCFIFMSFLY